VPGGRWRRVLAGLALDDLERAVDDAFRGRLLAVAHQAVHEFGENGVAVFGVGDDLALFGAVAA
jgi:hypothetical protein